MNYAPAADSFHVPNVRQRPYRRFFWQFWREKEPVRRSRPKPAGDEPQELPSFLRHEVPGKGDVRQIPGRHFPEAPKLSDFEPKQEPVEEPKLIKPIDPIADLKLLYRTMSYGMFMEAMSAIAGQTQESHDVLPRNTWIWATT